MLIVCSKFCIRQSQSKVKVTERHRDRSSSGHGSSSEFIVNERTPICEDIEMQYFRHVRHLPASQSANYTLKAPVRLRPRLREESPGILLLRDGDRTYSLSADPQTGRLKDRISIIQMPDTQSDEDPDSESPGSPEEFRDAGLLELLCEAARQVEPSEQLLVESCNSTTSSYVMLDADQLSPDEAVSAAALQTLVNNPGSSQQAEQQTKQQGSPKIFNDYGSTNRSVSGGLKPLQGGLRTPEVEVCKHGLADCPRCKARRRSGLSRLGIVRKFNKLVWGPLVHPKSQQRHAESPVVTPAASSQLEEQIVLRGEARSCGPSNWQSRGQQQHYATMISYHRGEGSQYALALKEALERLGVSVYLDQHEIVAGCDWQDSLNDAILSCEALVPLVTQSYGQTRWTGRELKLADVLAKHIIPVNFCHHWPPTKLAVQFATLQYIFWLAGAPSEAYQPLAIEQRNPDERGPSEWHPECVNHIARLIKRSLDLRRCAVHRGQLDEAASFEQSHLHDSGYESSPALQHGPHDPMSASAGLSQQAPLALSRQTLQFHHNLLHHHTLSMQQAPVGLVRLNSETNSENTYDTYDDPYDLSSPYVATTSSSASSSSSCSLSSASPLPARRFQQQADEARSQDASTSRRHYKSRRRTKLTRDDQMNSLASSHNSPSAGGSGRAQTGASAAAKPVSFRKRALRALSKYRRRLSSGARAESVTRAPLLAG